MERDPHAERAAERENLADDRVFPGLSDESKFHPELSEGYAVSGSQISVSRSMVRSLLCLIPAAREWFDEVDHLAYEARLWQGTRHLLVGGDAEDQAAIRDLLSYFTPRRALHRDKVRLGRDHDGGYVMLDDFASVRTAISFGIDGDCSWDEDIAARGIEVYQFDHTIEAPPRPHGRFHFYRKKVAPMATDECVSLASVLASLPNEARDDMILKIDIEGDEWDVIAAASAEDLGRFRQIVCEFHDLRRLLDAAWRGRAIAVLEKLTSLFSVVHVHGNNNSPVHLIVNLAVPDVLEVTFARKSTYACADTDEIFPTALDRPNIADRPEIFLGSMKFR